MGHVSMSRVKSVIGRTTTTTSSSALLGVVLIVKDCSSAACEEKPQCEKPHITTSSLNQKTLRIGDQVRVVGRLPPVASFGEAVVAV